METKKFTEAMASMEYAFKNNPEGLFEAYLSLVAADVPTALRSTENVEEPAVLYKRQCRTCLATRLVNVEGDFFKNFTEDYLKGYLKYEVEEEALLDLLNEAIGILETAFAQNIEYLEQLNELNAFKRQVLERYVQKKSVLPEI